MENIVFIENALEYQDYCGLRESVKWMNLPRMQTEKVLKNSLYTIVAVKDKQVVGMGRLVGDGIYYMVVDVVVHPACQKNGIGSKIVNMLIRYAEKETPPGGRSSIQLIAEKRKEAFYEKMGFKAIPHDFCGSGMRKIIRK